MEVGVPRVQVRKKRVADIVPSYVVHRALDAALGKIHCRLNQVLGSGVARSAIVPDPIPAQMALHLIRPCVALL